MTTPVEMGTALCFAAATLVLTLGIYGGLASVLIFILLLLLGIMIHSLVLVNTAELYGALTITGLLVIAIVCGTIINPLLGLSMLVSAIAGLALGFMFKAKGWWWW